MGKTISLDSTIAATSDQISCQLGADAAILNLKSGMYFGLDGVGATVWDLIAEPKVVNDILETLLERYEVDRERCQNDLLALLAELDRRGLIEIREKSAL
jgi:hypothetical protein